MALVMTAEIAKKPWWVVVSLWGMPTRWAMWLWFWCAIAAAIGTTGFALATGRFIWLAGGLMLAAAVPYWMTIRWMDAHRAW